MLDILESVLPDSNEILIPMWLSDPHPLKLINSKFMLVFFFSALSLLSALRASKSEGNGVILDTFDYGSPAFGPEEVVVDYAVLAADRKMDLPT